VLHPGRLRFASLLRKFVNYGQKKFYNIGARSVTFRGNKGPAGTGSNGNAGPISADTGLAVDPAAETYKKQIEVSPEKNKVTSEPGVNLIKVFWRKFTYSFCKLDLFIENAPNIAYL
jgi:hypothetical protein